MEPPISPLLFVALLFRGMLIRSRPGVTLALGAVRKSRRASAALWARSRARCSPCLDW